jgi:hypothetical protein
MIEIPSGLPSELVPLSWLIGVWEGTGVIDYKIGDETVTREFGQRVSFSHDGLPYLNYNSYTWLLPEQPAADAEGASTTDADSLSDDDAGAEATDAPLDPLAAPEPLVTETGVWNAPSSKAILVRACSLAKGRGRSARPNRWKRYGPRPAPSRCRCRSSTRTA